jgi:hypothetical protein
VVAEEVIAEEVVVVAVVVLPPPTPYLFRLAAPDPVEETVGSRTATSDLLLQPRQQHSDVAVLLPVGGHRISLPGLGIWVGNVVCACVTTSHE